ncbi:MAG: sigma 54-interacting transcriptional regulator [Hornefia sp.]|nr:sigma 54-interacting transcriptional regulator [Hornefia sp.]
MRTFGEERVLEPKGFFPVSAWRLDNNREINDTELRISIHKIKLEEGNFRQICSSCEYDYERIKKRILGITERRGKLHNQLTDSGGICCGVIEEIGDNYNNPYGFKVGDRVIGIASLTSIPIKINEIKSLNFNYSQIEVDGYGIFFSASPVIKIPEEIPEEVLLVAFDESGSIAKAAYLAEEGRKFFILGSDIFTTILYAAAMRFSNGVGCYISVCLYFDDENYILEENIRALFKPYVDKLFTINGVSPMDSYNKIIEKEFAQEPTEEDLFDSTVICSNMMGMEVIGVLMTKQHGNLFFTNLINNYNLVVLVAESLGKSINTISMEEYSSGFPDFTLDLLYKIRMKLNRIHDIYVGKTIVNKLKYDSKLTFDLKNIKKIDEYAYGSRETEKMLEEVLRLASYDCNVLILGETGVGKERILDLLHENSSRKGKQCIKINCSAITESLAESEFFGYEKGSFTGANDTGKKGIFEMANGGTLFLDEIGDLPLSIQAKMLRVLQEGQFYRVGGEKPINVNVRVISATNKDLREMVREGTFREDLYYRLNICEIEILPLRMRTDDIEPLVKMFAKKYNDKYMLARKFTIDAIDELKKYDWPGNVRQLENVVHTIVISSKTDVVDDKIVNNVIEKKTLEGSGKICDNAATEKKQKDFYDESGAYRNMTLEEAIGNHEKAIIEDALKRYGTTRKAADALDISQSQLMRKKKKYDI